MKDKGSDQQAGWPVPLLLTCHKIRISRGDAKSSQTYIETKNKTNIRNFGTLGINEQ